MLCFLVAGRRMFQSPGGLLLILSVRSHCNQESGGYTHFLSGNILISFRSVRQKIEGRCDMEVVIPIIPPLQTILDQIAAPPIKGSLVFPDIYGDAQTPIDRRKRVAMENQNIKKRVRRLVKSMGWEVQPSCTWCRHSFATNLTHAGVPHNYISESMGHSVDSNITNRYIDAFPLAQQMEFNSRLLKLNDDADIMEELKGQIGRAHV